MQKYLLILFLMVFKIGFGQSKAKIDSVSNLSITTIQQNLDKSIVVLRRNVFAAKRTDNIKAEAKTYYLLGLAYYYRGDYDENMSCFLKSIAAYSKINDRKGLAEVFGEMGYRLKDSDLIGAQKFMLKGMQLAEQERYEKALADIYNNYGTLKALAKQHDSALFYFEKSLVIKRKLVDSIGIPYSLNNIGEVYLKEKQFSLARKFFREAMTYRVRMKDQYGIADNYAYSGDLFLAEKDYPNAIAAYKQSLELAEKYKITNLRKHVYAMLSKTYEENGGFQQALAYSKIKEKLSDSLSSVESRNKITELQMKFESTAKEKQISEQKILARKRNATIWVLGVVISSLILITFLVYHSLEQKNENQRKEFELKAKLEHVEYENRLQQQRLQISRDLHDNIGAHLTCLSLSIEGMKRQIREEDIGIKNQLDSIVAVTREATRELPETIHVMNQTQVTFSQLKIKLSQFTTRLGFLNLKIDMDESLEDVQLEASKMIYIYRIIQEGLNNALKYSEGDFIRISIQKDLKKVVIRVSDNGKGFDQNTSPRGNGLINMKNRASDIHWKLHIHSQFESGTTVVLTSPEEF